MDSSTVGWQEGYAEPPPQTPPVRYQRGGPGFDIREFVNRVADQFQEAAGIPVDRSARKALIEPALPHAYDYGGRLIAAWLER